MGIADIIEKYAFAEAAVIKEQMTEFKIGIAEAGVPVIEFLANHFAKDVDKPTIGEMARMAITAVEVGEFLSEQVEKEVERVALLEELSAALDIDLSDLL